MSAGQELWIVAIVFWIACGIVASAIAAQKQDGITGFIVGVLFGPLGVLAACFLDNRERCPHCRHRIDAGVRMCGVCRNPVGLSSDHGLSPSTLAIAESVRAEEIRKDQEYHAMLRAAAEERTRDQRQRDKEALIKFLKTVRHQIIDKGLPLGRSLAAAITYPVRAANQFLDIVSEGSKGIKFAYIALGCFLLLAPLLLLFLRDSFTTDAKPLSLPEHSKRPNAVKAQ